MSALFHENMSYADAQRAFFNAVAGKSRDEKKRIAAEYDPIASRIIMREFEENEGWLTSQACSREQPLS